MDRNNVIGFVLLGALIIAFFFVQSRYADNARVAEAAKQQTEDSIKRVQDSLAKLELPKETAKQETTISALPDSLKNKMKPEEAKRLEDSLAAVQRANVFGSFTPVMQGKEEITTLENDKLILKLSNKGGRIVQAEIKDHKNYHGGLVDVIGGDNNRFNYNFYYEDNKMMNTEEMYFTPSLSSDGKTLTYTAKLSNGASLEQIYSFTNTEYLVDYNVRFNGFRNVIPGRDPVIILNWRNEMQEQEKNIKYERQYSKLYFGTEDGDVDYKNTNGDLKFEDRIKWVSCQQQFFNATLIAKESFEKNGKIDIFADDTSRFVKRCNTELYLTFNGKDSYEFPMQWYLAPNQYDELKALDLGIETIIPTGSGFIGWINKTAIMPLFHWLSGMISNYGLIILLMTLILKLALSPLTYRSYLSMAKMRVLNPEVAELREKYGDDQAKLGAEQMKLFRKAGVNPLGGCIPTLLSMPILIAMFRLFPGTIQLRQQSFLWADDMSTYDDIIHWGTNIPFIGTHISIFCILMTISSILYMRMNMQNTSQLTGPMKTVQYITPVFFFFFLNSSPAALTYYYFVSNLTTFGQQWAIRKFLINDEEIHRRIQENKSKPEKAKSGFAKRLEDAMKQSQQIREQQKKGKK
ncbi:MAG TPA: membrane protein insertase YidC [Chitinophagales bacterium]|nr:membrane protein insertase YidC [Chitinophagales bacterium]HMX03371.1 membrane protein insertase YidC [Chitinophagales bacterium]HNA58177.1 membrane protein insertase YidC [Chitinophagales bacterium]HNE46198.1 membrane protein insertase YidC [Chitinophagales bacterium]HNF68656.1 membrane protein insertase YidC [Chitinophagales bacterium]